MTNTDYKLVFHDGERIHFMFFNAHSSESAILRLYESFPTAKVIEVHALKAEPIKNITFINNLIRVDFKSKRRIA